MKKQPLFFVWALAVCLMSGSSLFAGQQDFILVNHTGATLYNLYISASNVNDWEEDVLGDQILESGWQKKIYFSNYENRRYWDLKVVDAYGNEVYWRHIDLLRITKITLYKYNGRVMANFE